MARIDFRLRGAVKALAQREYQSMDPPHLPKGAVSTVQGVNDMLHNIIYGLELVNFPLFPHFFPVSHYFSSFPSFSPTFSFFLHLGLALVTTPSPWPSFLRASFPFSEGPIIPPLHSRPHLTLAHNAAVQGGIFTRHARQSSKREMVYRRLNNNDVFLSLMLPLVVRQSWPTCV